MMSPRGRHLIPPARPLSIEAHHIIIAPHTTHTYTKFDVALFDSCRFAGKSQAAEAATAAATATTAAAETTATERQRCLFCT